MLIIGHRGAAGLKPENTLEGLRAGVDAGADMLEFDIRTTSDGVPVLMHDSSLLRTNGIRMVVHQSTLEELRAATESSEKPIVTFDEVMQEFFGKIMLNIELKQHGGADALVAVLKKYCTSHEDWSKFVISSFFPKEFARIRRSCPHAELWLLHGRNPFIFVAYTRRLGLSGVGFNRMYLNDFALEIARKSKLFTYVFTINRLGAMQHLADLGIDGLVTNFPDRFAKLAADSKDS
jgi:glycerophosphoryl diester phosphodiesterase